MSTASILSRFRTTISHFLEKDTTHTMGPNVSTHCGQYRHMLLEKRSAQIMKLRLALRRSEKNARRTNLSFWTGGISSPTSPMTILLRWESSSLMIFLLARMLQNLLDFPKPSSKESVAPLYVYHIFHQGSARWLLQTTWEYEMNWHHQSGFALYGFWGIVLCVSAVVHLLRTSDVLFPSVHMQSSKIIQIMHSVWTWVRVNLIIPPTFGSHHQRLLYWCTIPTRMESIVVTAFYLFTTYLSVSHYRLISNNI
jgi:hypothetical protein